MQFVWVYWDGAQKDELRWSIRSVLANYRDATPPQITVVGDRPKWYCGHHIHVPRVAPGNNRAFRDSLNKLIVALESDEVADTFTWIMDDIYFIHPVRPADIAQPRYDSKFCEQRMARWRPSNRWQRIKRDTIKAIGKLPVWDWATHLPHVVRKDRLRETLQRYDVPNRLLLWELLYGHDHYRGGRYYSPFFARFLRAQNYRQLVAHSQKSVVWNNAEGAWNEALRAFLSDRFRRQTDVERYPAAGIKRNFNRGSNPIEPADVPPTPPKIVACVPMRKTPDRAKGWRWVREYLDNLCDDVITADSDPDRPFNRAQAINNCVRQLPADTADDTVLCIVDADCVITRLRFTQGAAAARDTGRLVIPHDAVCRMTREQSDDVLANHCPTVGPRGRWWRDNRGPQCCSGLLFIRLDSFRRVNGFDESFIDWGGEDNAFRIACKHLLGEPIRLDGPLFHFWHPRVERSHPHYESNHDRYMAYRDAVERSVTQLVSENGLQRGGVEHV